MSPLMMLMLLLLLVLAVTAGRDFYSILGVQKSASEREIKRAYRKLSLQYHPDKNPGDEQAQQKFMEIGNAYDVLSNAEKRRVYDRHGEEGLKNGGQQQGGFNPFDIFANFGFGGGGQRAQQEQRGEDLELDLFVSLKDLYVGKSFSVEVQNKKICHNCRGSGAKSDSHTHKCHACGGNGVRMQRIQLAPGMFQQMTSTCDVCGGTGRIVKEKCPVCKGEKILTGMSELDVYIEKGMPDGHKITFEHASDENPDKSAGHVIFKVNTAPDANFTRKGDDLEMDFHISLLEALVGFEKEFKHLDGHSVSLTRSSVTSPGQILLKKGEGMPLQVDPSSYGNLFVKIVVDFPNSISDEQKKVFGEILR